MDMLIWLVPLAEPTIYLNLSESSFNHLCNFDDWWDLSFSIIIAHESNKGQVLVKTDKQTDHWPLQFHFTIHFINSVMCPCLSLDIHHSAQRKPGFPQAYSVQSVQNVQSNFEPIWRPGLAWMSMSELSINTMKVCEEPTLASDWPILITWPQHWPLIGQYSPLCKATLHCHVMLHES